MALFDQYELYSAICRKRIRSVVAVYVTGQTIQSGYGGVVVEYRTRNREVAGSTHTWSTASSLEQLANLLCAQANSASYPQRDGKSTATG